MYFSGENQFCTGAWETLQLINRHDKQHGLLTLYCQKWQNQAE